MLDRDGISWNGTDGYEVFVKGECIATCKTSREAWRIYDKATNEHLSGAESRHEWSFNQGD